MFQPIMDRVLLRKIEREQTGDVIIPDQYRESQEFEVVALGDFVIISQVRVLLGEFLCVGDHVLVGQYNLEKIQVDGETLYLSRIQDVKGRERAEHCARAAA
jgi:co-chaperonin GroES (HSP10)